MNEKSKKEWKKPKLQKLEVVGNKVKFKGKLYSIKEILNDEKFNSYFDLDHPSPKKDRYFYF